MGRPSSITSMGCTRGVSTACSSGYHRIEGYLWSIPRRPRYFEEPPYVTMSAHTLYPITVAADGPYNSAKKLDKVLRDEKLDRSLINARIAGASGGSIQQLPSVVTLQDSAGRVHYCSACVGLRWRQYGLARSWSERFYLVEDCGRELDAILRADVSLETPPSPESLPLEHRLLTEEEKLALEAKRLVKAKQREEQKKAENLRINNSITQKETLGQGRSGN